VKYYLFERSGSYSWWCGGLISQGVIDGTEHCWMPFWLKPTASRSAFTRISSGVIWFGWHLNEALYVGLKTECRILFDKGQQHCKQHWRDSSFTAEVKRRLILANVTCKLEDGDVLKAQRPWFWMWSSIRRIYKRFVQILRWAIYVELVVRLLVSYPSYVTVWASTRNTLTALVHFSVKCRMWEMKQSLRSNMISGNQIKSN